MRDKHHRETIQGIFQNSTMRDKCCVLLGLLGYALFSTWGILLLYNNVLQPLTGEANSDDFQVARIIFYSSLLILHLLIWAFSTKVRPWWHRPIFIAAIVFSMANCIYFLLPFEYNTQAMWLSWAITVVGYISLIFLWGRFFNWLSSACSAYFVTIATFISGLGFLVISYMQPVPSIIAMALMPLLSVILYGVAAHNLDLLPFSPMTKREIFKTVKASPFIASFLYSIPMGLVGAYFIYWGPEFVIAPLLIGCAVMVVGAVMFTYVNIPRFLEISAFWSLPIFILFLNLLMVRETAVEVFCCTALVFFTFVRSTSNRRAVNKILSGKTGYPLGAHAYGRLANTFGVLLGWILGWISLKTGSHETMLLVFVALNVLLIVPGSFFLTDYFPRDITVDDQTKKGWWKRRCAIIAAKDGLTIRQREIMILLAKGRNSHYMAESLCLSHHTVRTHIQAIYKKLDVHSRQELLDYIDNYQIDDE
jgi:DNA-binding CsgD family transcriptional regulator